MADMQNIYMIHIGKTGGTYLKQIIRDTLDVQKESSQQIVNDNLILLNHVSLEGITHKYGPIKKMAFVFRDPTERFLSGFYCRLRMGRPDYNVLWDAREAVAFSHFQSANELAEALYSEDDFKKSAAWFSMNANRHLRRGYQFYFGNQNDFIFDEVGKIVSCIDIKNLDENIDKFMGDIGITKPINIRAKGSRPHVHYPKELSFLAKDNLRKFWKVEYEYYEMFKDIEEQFLTKEDRPI